MLLDPDFAIGTDRQDGSDSALELEAGACLLARVRKAFPALPVRNSRVEHAGGDHVLLIVDDDYVFRFPRAGMHDLRLEIGVLKLLQRRSIVPTPCYDHIDPAGQFAGYRFIAGVALTPARFTLLSAAAQDRVLAAAARFLSALHSLSVDAVAWPDRWPKTWTASEFADRGISERLPVIVRHAPHLAGRIAAFYDAYRNDRPKEPVIVHGDFVTDHILIDERSGRLAGVIDFGDVAMGDPAQDFLGLWSYGSDAAARAVALYDPRGADPGLLDRSRNHFIRYRLDQALETLADRGACDAPGAIAEIDALMSRFPASR